MDFSESTKVVYNRIQKLEPESVSKIVGYLLLQDHGDRDMIRLAFSPDNVIQSLITKAKTNLSSLSKQSVSPPISPSQPLHFTPYSPTPVRPETHFTDDQLVPFNDLSGNYFYQDRISPSSPDFPVKVCHYFNKGFCKHGNKCRYFHCNPLPETFSQAYGQTDSDDHLISPVSLEKVELELTELLKARRGFPVSIASLPMMYYEKYGRTLQAEGYLTESQRHGKAGFSLTKLLARLKNSIRLIDRPHGQHSVILAEDVPKYLEYIGERSSDSGLMVAGSRQIYLTFPAESTFTEQDVSNYFTKFGHVQDVRIPCQQKRMFGFVTFVYAETVKQILAKGNPHFVCGARVLVKPYREKSRLVDRKYTDKVQNHGFYGSHIMDSDSTRVCEHEKSLDIQTMRFSEMQLAAHNPYFGYSTEELRFSEARTEQADFSSAEHFDYLLDVLNNGNSGEENVRRIKTGYNDPDSSQGLNLPESPFAAPIVI